MRHTDILKQAWAITWRYRVLWVFGFLLALCSGGGGGGGSGNFRAPGGEIGGDFGELPPIPEIDPQVIIALGIGLLCLVILLAIIGVVVRAVTRTAIIRMVHQVTVTQSVTLAEGWRLGWSRAAWRLFLVGLVIAIPIAILVIGLLLLAFSPLLLILTEEPALIFTGIAITVFAFIFVVLFFLALSAVIGPLLELSWRYTTLSERGAVESVTAAFALIKRFFKDIFIMWLLMLAVQLGWAIVSFVIVIISLFVALVVGGIPALFVYLISESWIGAAVAGVPLGLLVIILISSLAAGLFLTFQSAVWTLTYLGLQLNPAQEPEPTGIPDAPGVSSPSAA